MKMKWNNPPVVAMFVAMILFVFTYPLAKAQSQSNANTNTGQSVNGAASSGASGNSGDTLNGGTAGGQSTGTFTGQDPVLATGGAGSTTVGTSSEHVGANSVQSQDKGLTNSLAIVPQGTGPNSVGVNGNAQGGSWNNLNLDKNNFVNGAQATKGGFAGTGSGAAPISITGNGLAEGSVAGTASMSQNHANSALCVNGDAAGVLKFGQGTFQSSAPTASAAGQGVGNAQSFVGGNSANAPFAGAGITGGANFNAVGGQSATGMLNINGKNNASMNAGTNSSTVSASAAITATAKGNGSN